MHALSNFFDDLRQFLFHGEFRIARPAWPAELKERLAKAVETASRATAESARAAESAAKAQEVAAKRQLELPSAPDINATLQERLKFLADVGTGLWRMRRNMIPPRNRPIARCPPVGGDAQALPLARFHLGHAQGMRP